MYYLLSCLAGVAMLKSTWQGTSVLSKTTASSASGNLLVETRCQFGDWRCFSYDFFSETVMKKFKIFKKFNIMTLFL
jgi:hypothetical protein